MRSSSLMALLKPGVFSLSLTSLLLLASCEEPDDLGLAVVDDTVTAFYTDTVTVDVSTVWLDSVVTSATGTMLVGKYTDALVGETIANAYFQLELGSLWALEDDARFDSIRLILPYTGYSYGDTTQAMQLGVYRLVENIAPQSLPPYVGSEEASSYFYTNSGLYNTSKTAASTTPLTTYTFKPRPTGTDSVFVPLPDVLGQEFFQLQQENDTKLSNSNEFLDYFKGLKLSVPEAAAGSSVVGFEAAGAVVRVYYTAPSDGLANSYYHDFPVTGGSTQYNQLSADFGTSYLSGISRDGTPVSSAATSDMAFVQSGVGVMVKLDFPYLTDLKTIVDPKLINSATLELYPVTGTTQYPFTVPASLAMYSGNPAGMPYGLIYKDYSTEEVQEATYVAGTENNQSGKYQFGITEYFVNRLESGSSNSSLLLAAPGNAFTQTVDRLVLGGAGHATQRVKLKIYYTKIQ